MRLSLLLDRRTSLCAGWRVPQDASSHCKTHRKAFVIEQYIRPEELPGRLLEWDEPKPSPDEIVVDVHYAGLNCMSGSSSAWNSELKTSPLQSSTVRSASTSHDLCGPADVSAHSQSFKSRASTRTSRRSPGSPAVNSPALSRQPRPSRKAAPSSPARPASSVPARAPTPKRSRWHGALSSKCRKRWASTRLRACTSRRRRRTPRSSRAQRLRRASGCSCTLLQEEVSPLGHLCAQSIADMLARIQLASQRYRLRRRSARA